MRQVIVRKGAIVVEEVSAPVIEPGTVLVRVEHSCISVGTELSGIRSSGTPLWQKALRNPQKVKRVLDVATSQGVTAARDMVSGRLAAGAETGYSAAGVVIEVGEGISDIRVGDRVACAGAQAAHHAEVIRVPRNLAVKVPDDVSAADASTVTLGAIALQGVRRASPTLGETFVVIGLGVLGQITAQLLRANGCRVIGIDLDAGRVALARELGMDAGLSGSDDDIEAVARLTGGVGVDGVIITASTPSDEVLSTAFKVSRRKGRVVLVGDVGLDIDRADIYRKELDFFVSTSYGPGRYDESYEEHGLDYPVGYVRWTENRNMQEYLRQVELGGVRLTPLVGATYALDDAPAAYDAVRAGSPRPVMVLLDYPIKIDPRSRRVTNLLVKSTSNQGIGVAVIGAGGFAKGMHLPNIRQIDDLRLEAIVSRSGPNAADTARQFGARYSSTDYNEVLADDRVDLVIITTRHDKHAEMVMAALRAGKHVLVEKPLALRREQLSEIEAFFDDAGEGTPVLLTGFNRRFSDYGRRIKGLAADRTNPMVLDYRMNAGYIPLDHWVHTAEGGGRNLGEACHIYDLFTYLTGAAPTSVAAKAIRPTTDYYSPTDNFVATISFADGSVATLTYTALGSTAQPKELMDIYVDGRIVHLEDYRELVVAGTSKPEVSSSASEKGQRQELEALVRALHDGGPWPIPLHEQLQAMDIALRVQDAIEGAG